MAVTLINITTFLELYQDRVPVIDVRSPSEFLHASIPSAHSIPLFQDDERAKIGTAYKQINKQTAIKIGLDFFGPNMRKMVEAVEKIAANRNATRPNEVIVHCWRGGMRSGAVVWLLDFYGFKVYQLIGGYKAYRNWVLEQFNIQYNFKIIGGYTGSGKTALLHQLQHLGENTIDLEGLAHHKGSTFGALGQAEQPSTEMFENELAMILFKFQTQPNQTIWIEDESQRIGHVNLPSALWQQLRKAKIYFIDIPFQERLNYIIKDYGQFSKESLINAILRIQKRLGGLDTKQAINFLLEDDVKSCFSLLLQYYDKGYIKALQKRDNWQDLTMTFEMPTVDSNRNAAILKEKNQI